MKERFNIDQQKSNKAADTPLGSQFENNNQIKPAPENLSGNMMELKRHLTICDMNDSKSDNGAR